MSYLQHVLVGSVNAVGIQLFIEFAQGIPQQGGVVTIHL